MFTYFVFITLSFDNSKIYQYNLTLSFEKEIDSKNFQVLLRRLAQALQDKHPEKFFHEIQQSIVINSLTLLNIGDLLTNSQSKQLIEKDLIIADLQDKYDRLKAEFDQLKNSL